MGRHFNVGDQTAIDTKPDAGFEFAGHGFDMNIGCFLVVGINDDFVDELDQFIVCSGGLKRIVAGAIVNRGIIHAGQKGLDGGFVLRRSKELPQCFLKLGLRGHTVRKL